MHKTKYLHGFLYENTHILYILLIFISICFSEFSKRIIFINGYISYTIYYTCIFLPIFTVFVYILAGNLKIEKQKFIVFFVIIIFEIIIVMTSNRSKLGSLIIYFGSVLFYIFPFTFKVFCTCKIKNCNYIFFSLFIITIIYGIIQHNIGYFIWELNWGKYSPTKISIYATSNWGHFTRAFSLFSGIQDFASFIIFITLLLWTHSKGNSIKLLLVLLLFIGLYIAGSKSMMISLIVAFIAYSFRKRVKANLLFFGLYILPYILILSLYISLKDVLVFELHDSIGLFNFGTILPRLEIIYNFFSSFNISNIFGVGLGCMEGVVDNMYIRILIETGIIGLLLFMFLIYTIYKQFYYIDKRSIQFSSSGENLFLFLLFVSITFSMHSGELLMSRYAIIAFVYVVMCINKKYKKIKEYELMSSSANS